MNRHGVEDIRTLENCRATDTLQKDRGCSRPAISDAIIPVAHKGIVDDFKAAPGKRVVCGIFVLKSNRVSGLAALELEAFDTNVAWEATAPTGDSDRTVP
jgi:hypothetical protein